MSKIGKVIKQWGEGGVSGKLDLIHQNDFYPWSTEVEPWVNSWTFSSSPYSSPPSPLPSPPPTLGCKDNLSVWRRRRRRNTSYSSSSSSSFSFSTPPTSRCRYGPCVAMGSCSYKNSLRNRGLKLILQNYQTYLLSIFTTDNNLIYLLKLIAL